MDLYSIYYDFVGCSILTQVMTKRRRNKKLKRSTPDKGNNSSGNSTSDSSLFTNSTVNRKSDQNKVLSTKNTLSTFNNSSPTNSYDQINTMNQGYNQYTPIQSSTPNMAYPFTPVQQFQQYPHPFTSPPPPPTPQQLQNTCDIELMLKTLCCKVDNIEIKLNKLDSIEHRLNNFEQKFSNVDTEIITCKERISVLEHSAEFMSDIKDEHKSIKAKIQTLTKSFEVSKTTSNSVKERLAGVEAQNLSNNLLFFAIEEKIVNVEMETNGAQGNVDEGNYGEGKKNIQENCLDIILDFCEQTLKIENAKANLKLEKAYRLGKKKVGESRPRPIVVKFSKYSDREMVRKSSKRLKGSDFGISPQYPQEVLAKRKKLIPVMLEKRKEKKTAYLVGDKLFVEGVLYDE